MKAYLFVIVTVSLAVLSVIARDEEVNSRKRADGQLIGRSKEKDEQFNLRSNSDQLKDNLLDLLFQAKRWIPYQNSLRHKQVEEEEIDDTDLRELEEEKFQADRRLHSLIAKLENTDLREQKEENVQDDRHLHGGKIHKLEDTNLREQEEEKVQANRRLHGGKQHKLEDTDLREQEEEKVQDSRFANWLRRNLEDDKDKELQAFKRKIIKEFEEPI